MKIFFVTGKGGVGKSAVAAALAHAHSQKGHRVLLAELGDDSFFAPYLGLSGVSEVPIPSKMGFEVALWSGATCLREYALHLLKVESLVRLFFDNAVSKALINVAPALAELAILGKITSGPPRNVGPKLPFDCIVVDAFASGHFMALMRAPKGMAQAVRLGPMGEQSRGIDAILRDPKIVQYWVVANPEDLIITESLELRNSIEDEMGIRPHLVLNRWQKLPPSTAPQNDLSPEFLDAMEALRKLQDASLTRLLESNPHHRQDQNDQMEISLLPRVMNTDSKLVVQTLAQEMSHAL